MEPVNNLPHELKTIDPITKETVIVASFAFSDVPLKLMEQVMKAYRLSKAKKNKDGAKVMKPDVKKARAQALLEEAARVTRYFQNEIAENKESLDAVQALTVQRDEWIKKLQEEANALLAS